MKLKRLTSLLLCAVMVIGMACTVGYADDDSGTALTEVKVDNATDLMEYLAADGDYDIILMDDIYDSINGEAAGIGDTSMYFLLGTGTKILESDPEAASAGTVYGIYGYFWVDVVEDASLTIQNLNTCASQDQGLLRVMSGGTLTFGANAKCNSILVWGECHVIDTAVVSSTVDLEAADAVVYIGGSASVGSVDVEAAGAVMYISGHATIGGSINTKAIAYISENATVGSVTAGSNTHLYLSGAINLTYSVRYPTYTNSIQITGSIEGATVDVSFTNSKVKTASNCTDPVAVGGEMADGSTYQLTLDDLLAFSIENSKYTAGGYALCLSTEDNAIYYQEHSEHTLTKVDAVDASCTEDGHSAYYQCSVCGAMFDDADGTTELSEDDVVVSATGHDYVADVTDPTCIEQGYTTYTCSVCGDSYVDEDSYTDALGHTLESVETENATCTEDGHIAYYRCSVCGAMFSDEEGTVALTESDVVISATGHTEGNPVVENEVAATCTEDGSYDSVVYCSACGEELSRTPIVIPASHTLEPVAAVNATCTEDGNIAYYVCSVCGKLFDDESGTKELSADDVVIPATGTDHVADEAVTETVDASCTEDGYVYSVVYCTLCGTELSREAVETIPATGHATEIQNAKDATCTEDGYTGDEVCTVCGETITAGEVIADTGHTTEVQNAKDATCTEDGYTGDEVCTVCGEIITAGEVIAATGHSTEIQNAKNATCTEEGYTGDTVCTVCGETITTGETIPATGHTTEVQNTKDATCTENGYTGDEVCTACGETITAGEVIAATGHTTEVQNAKKATCTEDGYTGDTVCTVCGEIITAGEVIAATGHSTEIQNAKDATCIEEGYTGDTVCTVCGETITTGETIPATGHTTEVQNTKDATCTENGYTGDEVCTACGETITTGEVIATTGHTTEVQNAKDATCTEEGYTGDKVCTVCGETITAGEVIAATGHTYGEPTFTWTENENGSYSAAAAFACTSGDDTQTVDATVTSETTAATCTVGGATVYTATVTFNGETYMDTMTVAIAATGHNYVGSVVKTEATCTEDGSYVITVACTECDDELYTYTYTISATGHTWDEGVETVAATRYTRGVTTYTCTECGETKTEYTNKVNATFLFDDVLNDSQYYFIPVYWAYDLGITSGTSATLFSPSQGCTRAQFVTFLYRLAQATGEDTSTETTSTAFTDVDSDDYFYEAVLWAAENGITDGTSTTTFTPNRTITRREAITMLYRYECAANGEPTVNENNPFDDVTTSDYAYTAILWAVEQGITSGTDETTFSPASTCTRAMMVTFLYRYAAIQD